MTTDRSDPRKPDLSRRDFLRASAGLALAGAGVRAAGTDGRAVILLLLVGGPSQLETFDPKPDAPSDVRGPFRPIATRVPGLLVSEHLPRLARRLDRVALIRTLHHDTAPIHETGLQLLQTGRLAGLEENHPPLGAIAARELGPRAAAPCWALLPGPLGSTGVSISQGQSLDGLTPDCRPFQPDSAALAALLAGEPARTREAYGETAFGRSCLAARRLVEAGTRLVVVNMYPTVFGEPSWDVHGAAPFSTFEDYARVVLPAFDRAWAALLDDLEASGRLDSTLVIATGEFGRTPKLNARGGRDHWAGAWTALAAGGGVRGGRAIGTTDAHAAAPRDRPVAATELAATLASGLGLAGGPAESIGELFA
jgi:hypothetical protein